MLSRRPRYCRGTVTHRGGVEPGRGALRASPSESGAVGWRRIGGRSGWTKEVSSLVMLNTRGRSHSIPRSAESRECCTSIIRSGSHPAPRPAGAMNLVSLTPVSRGQRSPRRRTSSSHGMSGRRSRGHSEPRSSLATRLVMSVTGGRSQPTPRSGPATSGGKAGTRTRRHLAPRSPFSTKRS